MQKQPEAPMHHSPLQAWLVILTGSLFFFYSFVQLNLFNPLSTELMKAFHLTAAELGQLSAIYFYADALFLIPAGIWLDRFSTKKILLVSMGVMTAGTFIFGWATNYWVAAMGRFAVGASAAFSFLCCIRAAARWFLPKQMAFVSGVLVTIAMIGGLVAQTPMAYLAYWLGWREAILLNGVLGIVFFLLIFFIFQDCPLDAKDAAQADRMTVKKIGPWRVVLKVFSNPVNWMCGMYTALMNLPVFILGAIWGIQYLTHAQGLPLVKASLVTATFFLGVIFGSPFFGILSDRTQRRVRPMLVGALTSTAFLLLLVFPWYLDIFELYMVFFWVGFLTSSQSLSYPVVTEMNPKAFTAAAVSVISISIMIVGAFAQPFFGWLIERQSKGHLAYSVHDFVSAMWLMPIGCFVAFFIAFRIKETYCQPQHPS